MARIFRNAPREAGESVAIAFSGGLDTRCAVAWLSRRASRSTRTPPTSRSPTRRTSATSRRARSSTARVGARLLDCREAHGRARASSRIQCGAFHLAHRRARSTSTPRRSAARSPPPRSCARCARTASHVFGDGSTHKGNDIQRFYRYGMLVDPTLRDLQAVARRRVRRARSAAARR